MLLKIQTVAESANGRIYARAITGQPLFPQNKDMALKAGDYAYVVKTLQTKTTNDAGELVDLAVPQEIWQITATFGSKAEAIDAAAEAGTLEAEVHAEVIKQAKALNLTEKQVAELADKAF